MDTQFGTGIATDRDGRTAGARAARGAIDDLHTERVDFCHVFCSSEYRYDAVLSGIRDVVGEAASLLGCSSAGEFSEDGTVETGVAVALVTSDTMAFHTGLGTGLSENVTAAVTDALADLPTAPDEYPYLSAITVHDGLVGVGERLALVTQRKLGPHVTLAGGSASEIDRDATTVFCDDTIAEDAVGIALIASSERPVITVNHGHRPISGPMEVTAADGNVVSELDGEPACDVWRDAVPNWVLETFDVSAEEFERDRSVQQHVLGTTGLGIDQGDGYKIRAPWIDDFDAGSLAFSVDVAEGTVLRVMYGDQDDQIQAAGRAAAEAIELADDQEIAGGFIYDCSCRKTILGDDFDRAVGAMEAELGVPFIGFATYGELAMQLGQTSGYHNTTTVVMLVPK